MGKENLQTVFSRMFIMLSLLPKAPERICTKMLKKSLDEIGYIVTERTIQRDLDKLSNFWQLTYLKHDGEKVSGWSFAEDYKVKELPNMDVATALVFKLVDQFTSQMLPLSVLDKIRPQFKRAEEILNLERGNYNAWPDKVKIIPNTPLLAPKIKEGILELVYEALLKGKKVRVLNYTKGEEEPYSFIANPLGLVFRDGTIYLVCKTDYYEDIEYKPLHRIFEAEIIEEYCEIPNGFSLDEYVKNGEFSWKLSDEILDFKAEFNESISFQLYETPLSKTQTITQLANGNIIVEAKVSDTFQLRWWLSNLEDQVRIIKPKRLYFEFKKKVNNLNSIYKVKSKI